MCPIARTGFPRQLSGILRPRNSDGCRGLVDEDARELETPPVVVVRERDADGRVEEGFELGYNRRGNPRKPRVIFRGVRVRLPWGERVPFENDEIDWDALGVVGDPRGMADKDLFSAPHQSSLNPCVRMSLKGLE